MKEEKEGCLECQSLEVFAPLLWGPSQGPSQSRKAMGLVVPGALTAGTEVRAQPIFLLVLSASGFRGRKKGMALGNLLVLF